MSAAPDAALVFEEEGVLGALPQTPQSSGGSSVVPMDTSSSAGSTARGGSEDGLAACGQADAAERQAKKRKLDERLCCICEVTQALPKFTFCRECKKDVQSCQNQAKKEERMAEWQRLTKTPEGLRHLILHYKAACPSKGQGMKRANMDWAQYLERVYSLKQTRLGVKEVYMDSRLLVSAAFRFSLSKLHVLQKIANPCWREVRMCISGLDSLRGVGQEEQEPHVPASHAAVAEVGGGQPRP